MALYNSNGSGIKRTIDSTAGACTANSVGASVSVSAFDTNSFVIAWYDSVDGDITFQVYNSSLENLTAPIDVDTDVGLSATVSTSALNSTTFVLGWYDATDEDTTFGIYSSSSSTITSATDVDATAGPASNSVSVSALNSTAFMFSWFDDTDNDASLQPYSISGTSLAPVFDVDGGAGDSRTVSVSAFNSSTITFGWFDAGGGANDASFRVHLWNATPISGVIDVDSDVGGSGRPLQTSVLSQSIFGINWYDSSTDTGIFAQTFYFNTSVLSSEITVQSASLRYLDIASEEYATGLQLCDDVFIVAIANTTAQNFWQAYYPNGTIWNGVCSTNFPIISNVNVSAITAFSAFVNWSTDVETNSTINYGITQSLGNTLGSSFTQSTHKFNLTDLSPGQTYYFNITSCIDWRCNSSGGYSFSTGIGDPTPVFGEPISPQIWTTETNVRYLINFTNNGTVSSNYTLNVTNVSGASYVYINQSSFLNVNNGSTVFFELNISTVTNGTYFASLNVTSLLDSTKTDGLLLGTTFLSPHSYSNNSVTSIANAPLDFNKFVVAWCDDTEEDISFGVFNTTGYLLTQVTDIDTTAGACTANTAGHSVSVSALNPDRFVVLWYDSGDSDTSFQIFYSNGTQASSIVDLDTDATASLAVSVSPLNSTAFVASWFDDTSNDISAAVYSSTGSTITSIFDIDQDVGEASQAVEVSAINSTAFGVLYFDDSGGGGGISDVYYVLYSYTGTAISSAVTVDSNAGNSRSVSLAVMNESSLVVSWVDVNDGAKRFAVYYPNGTARVAVTSIDTDATGGEDIRVSAITQDDFVVSWYDPTTDTGIYSQAYLNNGTALSSIITVQSNSQQYTDVASEEFTTQIQLCEDAYIASFVNTTTHATWNAYYPNGTLWNGICPTYVPEISNVNVSDITIISAFVNWSTNVEANSSIKYGTTLALTSGSQGYNFPKTIHGFNLTGLSGQETYYFNATSCRDGRCNTTGPHSFTTSTIDTINPFVSLVSPSDGATISNPFDFYFVYNVTDVSNIANCSIYIDGTPVQTFSTISKGVNQTFNQYLSNGTYLWAVSCTDQYSNSNITSNRTIISNAVPWSFGRRFYETYTSNGIQNQTSVIWLNNSQDATQNNLGFNITAQTVKNILNASTQVMGSNGAVIPAGSIVDFSSSFSLSSANIVLTWKVYIENSSGSTLLCQNGDDSSGGTASAGTATGQNTTCISSDIRLKPSDRMTYLINAYNTHATQLRSIIHSWDSPTSSFLDINVTTEGFLNVDLVQPTVDTSISTGQQLNATCQVACTVGTCRNTQVYLQRNSSTESWANISSSGNIILSTGETNPHSLGNISTASLNSNFSIQGSIDSVNNIRCIAVSTYDSKNGATTRQITVGQSDVAPIISLSSPANATWYNSQNVTVFYNITDINSNVVNSTLILNGARNSTNASVILLGVLNNFSLVNLANMEYSWTINASDSTNLEGTNTTIRTFYVDTISPSINLSAPENDSTFQISGVEFNYTAFDNMDQTLICNLTIDSTIEHLNVNSANATLINLSVSNLAVGTHYWNVSCIDEAGNLNNSITKTFTILDIAPVVDLITTNATYSTTGNITLEYNVTDNNGLLQTRLILNNLVNQTNQTPVLNGQYNNFSLTNLGEGLYLWNINATDTGGLNSTNHSSRTFFVDLNAPNITLNLPNNNTPFNSSTVNFNFTVIDNVDSNLVCSLFVGERSDLNFVAVNGSITNRQITNLIDGGFYWNVSCVDDSGRSNYSETRLVNITEYPRITLNTANNSFFNTTSFNLSYTPSDNTNLSFCELYIDGSYNQTHSSPSNGLQSNFSMSGVSSGAHTWNVICNDTYELTNISQTRAFTVDTNGLNVELIYPNDGAQFFTSNLNLSFNATDNLDPFLLCNITVNNLVVNTSLASSGIIVNRSIAFASGGLKYWNVTCHDDANNKFTSLTRNFTIEQAPSVGLVDPSNNTFSNTSNIAFLYNVLDDNNNIANATLILNGNINQTNTTAIINDAENNITVSLPDGFYNWTINVTDLTNLVGTETPSFVLTIDTKKPWIELNSPPNNTLIASNNITFNYTAYDLIDSNLNCNISIDDVVAVGNIDSQNGTSVVRSLTKSDGVYTWNVNCRDDSSNLNYSETRTFTVEAPPLVTNLNPLNEEYLNSSNVIFTYIPEDAIGIFNCSLLLDGVINSSSGTITANANNSFAVNGVSEGKHSWNVTCFDVFPDFNQGSSNLTNFTVDITFPQINLNLPVNGSNTLKLVNFNFTAIDNIDTDLTCNLYTDNVLNISSISSPNGTATVQSVNKFALGLHTWNVSCADNSGNRNWSNKFSFNVTLTDFMINFSDIQFNMSNPSENDTVSVNATIHNLVNVSVPNVTVSFFQGEPGNGGIQLGPNYTTYDILGLSDTLFSINWSVPLGTNQIYINIDPPISSNGTIEEWNETNNVANNSASVSGWQFVYGEIGEQSVFSLSGQRNQSLLFWNASNYKNGSIFATDKESVVFWYSLQALGRSTLGGTTTNDFTDLDSILEMSSFGDSVTGIFSNGTEAPETIDSYIFNRMISNIPVTNSTNSTVFRTGILWDTSDDVADGQFSQDDEEDVVFMASIKKDTQGAYGVYDYEIRVPAKLREYNSADMKAVYFYAELI